MIEQFFDALGWLMIGDGAWSPNPLLSLGIWVLLMIPVVLLLVAAVVSFLWMVSLPFQGVYNVVVWVRQKVTR